MKLRTVPVLFTLVCAFGCASQKGLVLDAVGPAPYALRGQGQTGYLVVYSALEQGIDFDSPLSRYRYGAFSILSTDGKTLLKRVRNDDGSANGSPEKMPLPVGKYRVVARANGYGAVS